MHDMRSAERPDPEPLFIDIADYVLSRGIDSKEAYDTARLCLMDSIACMMLALNFPACTKLLAVFPARLTGERKPKRLDAKRRFRRRREFHVRIGRQEPAPRR